MRNHPSFLAAVALSVLAAIPLGSGAARGAEAFDLRQKFRKGETNRLEIRMDMDMKMARPGMGEAGDMKMKMTHCFELLHHVVDVTPKGAVTLEMTYDRIKQTMDMGVMKLSFDSKDDAADEESPVTRGLAAALRPMVGLKLTIKLDEKHRVKSVSGFDAYWKALDRDSTGAALRKQMSSMFGDEQLKNMMDQWFSKYLPPKKVTVGESWTIDDVMETPMLGGLQVKATSTLIGVEDHKGKRCAKIAVVGHMKTSDTQPTSSPSMPGVKAMKIKKCDMKGLTWFDLKAGQFAETDMEQDMHISMSLDLPDVSSKPSGSASKMEQKIKMRMRMTMKPEPAGPKK